MWYKMNNQALGAGLSLLIHAVLITIVLLMGSLAHIEQRAIVIDFSMGDSSGSNQQSAASSQQSQRAEDMSEPVKQREAVQAKVESPVALTEVKEQVQEESSVPVPIEEKPLAALAANIGALAVSPLPQGEGVSSASQGITDTGGSLENAKDRYSKEYFTYIRDIIMKNLSYPLAARRMGWKGRVVVSFVVNEDGHASDIKVIEGSGFGVLDKNAVETVKKSSPFPKPPVRAELVMPIVYELR